MCGYNLENEGVIVITSSLSLRLVTFIEPLGCTPSSWDLCSARTRQHVRVDMLSCIPTMINTCELEQIASLRRLVVRALFLVLRHILLKKKNHFDISS